MLETLGWNGGGWGRQQDSEATGSGEGEGPGAGRNSDADVRGLRGSPDALISRRAPCPTNQRSAPDTQPHRRPAVTGQSTGCA